MSFDIFIQLCNHYSNQNIKHFYHALTPHPHSQASTDLLSIFMD